MRLKLTGAPTVLTYFKILQDLNPNLSLPLFDLGCKFDCVTFNCLASVSRAHLREITRSILSRSNTLI